MPRRAAAQWNVARFDTDRGRVYTTAGIDPAVITTAGYARVLPVFGKDVRFFGDGGVVAAKMDWHDFRARLGMHAPLVRWRSVYLTASSTFITRGTKNSVYQAVSFGADLTGTVGVYRRGWYAAGEVGKDKSIMTHVTNSDWYRTYFYPDAKDGWYLDDGGTIHLGIAGGVDVRGVELQGRAGVLRTERFNQMIPPLYATLGVGFGIR
jgi:hypothetical protein